MRKEIFEEGNFYHIYNRGVDKRPIFLNDRERIRFIHSLYLLNNFLDIPNRFDVLTLEPQELLTPIKPYVEIIAGCLMPNHYHLILTPLRKNGISLFQHKIGTSYTKYFNRKHERTGRLFGSTFHAKLIDKQEYALYLTQYIHLNPAKMYQAKLGTERALEEIEGYEWSSLPSYFGKHNNFSIALSPSFLDFRNKILDMNSSDYRKFLRELFYSLYQA